MAANARIHCKPNLVWLECELELELELGCTAEMRLFSSLITFVASGELHFSQIIAQYKGCEVDLFHLNVDEFATYNIPITLTTYYYYYYYYHYYYYCYYYYYGLRPAS